jgi:NAD(P)-dependent dehydrogenase (short-subunit alcohol dehydrogenase family)
MTDKIINLIKPGLVVLVTAGASGIGRVIAESFLAHGCYVHVCDIDKSAMEHFLSEYPNASGTIADVSDNKMVQELFDDIKKRYGHLDVLVNNACTAGPLAAVEVIDLDAWEKTLAVNLN